MSLGEGREAGNHRWNGDKGREEVIKKGREKGVGRSKGEGNKGLVSE